MTAEVQVRQGDIGQHAADAIVVNLFSGVTAPGGATGAVDDALGGRISDVIAAGDLTGKLGQTTTLYGGDALGARRVIVVGLGDRDAFGLEEIRRASAAAASAAADLDGVRTLATIAHGAGIGGIDPAAATQATVEGALLALYDFEDYRSEAHADDNGGGHIEALHVVEFSDERLDAVRNGAALGEAVAAGTTLARDLANHPANVATPSYLAEVASEIAERHGMRLETWDRAQIIEAGMGAFASVAAGSDEEPRFIILEYAPPQVVNRQPYVLAGKAVTFDSGGISLKPGLKMGLMKYDMSGGAAVLGAMETVGQLELPVRVVGLVGATENLPSGHATKPGDIVRARNGTTIEVLNTDAEGRLVLADALSYATELDPAAVVDLATLTGAIITSLGHEAAGLFSNDDAIAAQLAAAGERSGERLWRLPTWERYGEMIESETADIKNTADTRPSPAGSIFGAKFLERFVGDHPWAHLDIAGMAWGIEDVPYVPKGGTGFGVRLLVEWLRERAAGG